jgi:phenylacetate-CoA ligase
MLVVRGVNVFPSQIEEVLLSYAELTSNYQILVDRQHDQLDQLEVHVEIEETRPQQEHSTLAPLQRRVTEDLHQALGLHAQVRLLEPHSLPRSEGKIKRIVDRRDLAQ